MIKAGDKGNKSPLLTGIMYPPKGKTTCKERDSPLSSASSCVSNNGTSPAALYIYVYNLPCLLLKIIKPSAISFLISQKGRTLSANRLHLWKNLDVTRIAYFAFRSAVLPLWDLSSHSWEIIRTARLRDIFLGFWPGEAIPGHSRPHQNQTLQWSCLWARTHWQHGPSRDHRHHKSPSSWELLYARVGNTFLHLQWQWRELSDCCFAQDKKRGLFIIGQLTAPSFHFLQPLQLRRSPTETSLRILNKQQASGVLP